MTLQDAFDPLDLPQILVDLSHVIDMVDGWALHGEQIDPDLAMHAARLLALISAKATP